MKKRILGMALAVAAIATNAEGQTTPASQMESLGRGLVAVPSSSTGVFVSWRMLGTEDENRTTFDVLRDGNVVKADIAYVSNYTDTSGKNTNKYSIVTKVDGVQLTQQQKCHRGPTLCFKCSSTVPLTEATTLIRQATAL
jgi:rhamnogalacturonan endolyase